MPTQPFDSTSNYITIEMPAVREEWATIVTHFRWRSPSETRKKKRAKPKVESLEQEFFSRLQKEKSDSQT